MTETTQPIAEQIAAAATFMGSVFSPGVGPVLKAQTDLLESAKVILSDWLCRRQEAVEDTQNLVASLRTSRDPLDALKIQQEWFSRAFLRIAADTAAYQAAAQQIADRAKTWFPQPRAIAEAEATGAEMGTESVASQTAAATRAAARPLREANTVA